MRCAAGRLRHQVASGSRTTAALAAAIVAVGLAIAASGCAAIALPAVGVSALSAGAGSAVRAGTEYTFGGTAARTHAASLPVVHEVLRDVFDKLEIKVVEETTTGRGRLIVRGQAYRRTVSAVLEPVTPSVTRLEIGVRRGLIRKDPATASMIISQTVAMLAPPGAASEARFPGERRRDRVRLD